jgi:uncharacterized membrane protein
MGTDGGRLRASPHMKEIMMDANDYTETIEVEAPVRVAYNQWTQFEDFPNFMSGVKSIKQLNDDHLHWIVEIAGVTREFDATITEQTPDQRIAWTTTEGTKNAGVVTFHSIDDNTTRVSLQMDFEPEGFLENAADKLGLVSARLKGDLNNFKKVIEDRQQSPGAWRGTIDHN